MAISLMDISCCEGMSGLSPCMTLPPIATLRTIWNSLMLRVPAGILARIVGWPSVNQTRR